METDKTQKNEYRGMNTASESITKSDLVGSSMDLESESGGDKKPVYKKIDLNNLGHILGGIKTKNPKTKTQDIYQNAAQDSHQPIYQNISQNISDKAKNLEDEFENYVQDDNKNPSERVDGRAAVVKNKTLTALSKKSPQINGVILKYILETLSKKDYSINEIKEKIAKKGKVLSLDSPEIQSQTRLIVEFLVGKNFVNEKRLIENLYNHLLNRGLGKITIKQKLKAHKIDPKLIAQYLDKNPKSDSGEPIERSFDNIFVRKKINSPSGRLSNKIAQNKSNLWGNTKGEGEDREEVGLRVLRDMVIKKYGSIGEIQKDPKILNRALGFIFRKGHNFSVWDKIKKM